MFKMPVEDEAFGVQPSSVKRAIAAVLEPGIMVLTFLIVNRWVGGRIELAESTLIFFLLVMSAPGRNRFNHDLLNVASDILVWWVVQLGVLFAFAWATEVYEPGVGLRFLDIDVILPWAIATPILQWLAVWAGKSISQWLSTRPSARRSAIIVGANVNAITVAEALTTRVDQGIDLVGYFDDRAEFRRDDPRGGDAAAVVPVQRLGALKDVANYVLTHGIREVYISVPLSLQLRIVRLLKDLQDTTASIFFVPDIFGASIINGRFVDINGLAVLAIRETPFTGVNMLTKRASDIVLATLILVLISPLLLVLAIGVKLSSPGPVLFRQRRNGLDGGEIVIYKFRSMKSQDDGPVVRQATRGDPRITPFGGFIRRTSLDELPQFINVLQGRMSIVGPRPHAVAHNEEYRPLVDHYMVRHKVKPGITGLAQVNGHRGETDTPEKMQVRVKYDIQYLQTWSVRNDLKIIVRTIRVLFFDRNAY